MLSFFLLFTFSIIISAQNIIINLGESIIGTLPPLSPSVTYAINVPAGFSAFQVTFWRTNVVNYQTASVSLNLRNPNNTNLNFTGLYTGSGSFIGFYNLTISPLGTASYAYLLQACPSSCTGGSLCHYTSANGYCYGNGACGVGLFGGCTCDNTTSSSTIILDSITCSASINTGPITDLFLSLLGVWIAVIVVAFILVFIVPIIVCCCCCGMCAAAAATAHETAPIVQHNYSHH